MIRIILLGRTGNHLFQYALGRVLAARHGVPLVMDGSWFNTAGWAAVVHFLKRPLRATVVRRWSIGTRALRKLTGKHYWEYLGVPVLREAVDDQSFDRRFLDAPADCLLFGYFQSPLYFESIAGPLRTELDELIGGAVTVGAGMRASLRAPEAVAVHVRRTDFLELPVFQVCDSCYYQEAMRRMRELVPGARFYIFSDDPPWCRAAFRAADEQVIDSGSAAANPLHDLHLMSLASHHIIANSSYSWWAAWLGNQPGQRVIMPDRWYAGGAKAPVAEKRLPHWDVLTKI